MPRYRGLQAATNLDFQMMIYPWTSDSVPIAPGKTLHMVSTKQSETFLDSFQSGLLRTVDVLQDGRTANCVLNHQSLAANQLPYIEVHQPERSNHASKQISLGQSTRTADAAPWLPSEVLSNNHALLAVFE
jgi:hypothetical protein